MEYRNMNIRLNKNKSIGKVLFIVEGGRTEPYILRKIFTGILDYQFETYLRDKGYKKYNSKKNPTSQVFVINAEESNIKNIARDNKFLNNLFAELIENYDFNVDNAAIYYLFDRDHKSNTDSEFIDNLVAKLVNARDNEEYDRQGMLLLSYPSIESFTVSNFEKRSFNTQVETGNDLKQYIHELHYNHQRISEDTLKFAVNEMLNALRLIEDKEFDVDAFGNTSKRVFEFEEAVYQKTGLYRVLSLVIVALLDLGVLETEEEDEKIGDVSS